MPLSRKHVVWAVAALLLAVLLAYLLATPPIPVDTGEIKAGRLRLRLAMKV